MLTTMIGRRFLPAAFGSLIRSRVSPERGDEPGVAQGLGGPEAVGRWKAGTGVIACAGHAGVFRAAVRRPCHHAPRPRAVRSLAAARDLEIPQLRTLTRAKIHQ